MNWLFAAAFLASQLIGERPLVERLMGRSIDVPAEIYRWTEAFVIANYFPEKKRKRKLRDWSADTHTRPTDA